MFYHPPSPAVNIESSSPGRFSPLSSDPSGTALPAGVSKKDAVNIVCMWLTSQDANGVSTSTLQKTLAVICEHTEKRDWCQPEAPSPACTVMVAELAHRSGLSIRTWHRAVKALADLGIIEIRTGRNGYRGTRAGDWMKCGLSLEPLVRRIAGLQRECAALAAAQTDAYRRIGEVRRQLSAIAESEEAGRRQRGRVSNIVNGLREEAARCLDINRNFAKAGGKPLFARRLEALEEAVFDLRTETETPGESAAAEEEHSGYGAWGRN